jgi:hypothetical protein
MTARFPTVSGPLILCAAALQLSAAEPTFSKEVARIFQAKCDECHHPGTAAPMSLESYAEARPWAKSIRERVVTRGMPPWNIDKTVGIQHFQNDRSLTDEQIATIRDWVDAGAPKGDPKDMPAPQKWPSSQEWVTAKLLGQPDFVVESPAYTLPAHGQDVWWKPVTALPITDPRWVRAVEIRPSTPAGRRIVHHAIAYLEQDEPTDAAAAPGGRPSKILMEWAVGKQNDVYPADSGKLLVPGARVRWELHLHAVGEEIRDHVELAVWLYPKGQEPKYKTDLAVLLATPRSGGSQVIDIPPNSTAVTYGTTVLRQPAKLQNFQPHMHLRGKAMLMEAILPDGTKETLSYVNNFNFNWMTNYIYAPDAEPVLPAGTTLKITAWYDNTANNRNNPDSNQWVGFGDRTVDEMGHAWVNMTYISQEDYDRWAAQHKLTASNH